MDSPAVFASDIKSAKRCAYETVNDSEAKRMKIEIYDENCKEDCHFNRLFEMVLNCVMQLKEISEDDVTKSVSSIIKEFQRGVQRFSNINLRKWKNLCGYLFRYGVHGASLTRIKVLDAVNNCAALKYILKKSHLQIITLGGGPGNDAIGLCSAFYECQLRSQLSITVVDKVQEWSLCVNLAKSFIPEGHFGNTSKLFCRNNIDLSFLKVKLPGNRRTDDKYFQLLARADIILVTKLISVLDWKDRKRFIMSLHRGMKEDAFILLIDSPFSADLWSNFDVLYLSEGGSYSQSLQKTERFQYHNNVVSKARIAVLCKK